MYSKSYRLYFSSEGYDFMKYKGHVSTPKLITQRDRQFYYRLATKLSDAQIHAAFLQAYFFKPTAYVSDVATPTAIQAGIEFASRAEHGTSVLGRDLYTLRKAIAPADLDQWLYGAFFDGFRATLPVCIEELVGRTLPVDVACLLLLIPRTESSIIGHSIGKPANLWGAPLVCARGYLDCERPINCSIGSGRHGDNTHTSCPVCFGRPIRNSHSRPARRKRDYLRRLYICVILDTVRY